MKQIYMLDTCICSFIMRQHPPEVLQKLQRVSEQHRLVISAITYSEMRYGAIGKRASPKHNEWINQFIQRLDAIEPWGAKAVESATFIKKHLNRVGTPIGANDTAIAGHAIALNCTLVTNNLKEFARVPELTVEDWVNNDG